jgi:hypothetical protein
MRIKHQAEKRRTGPVRTDDEDRPVFLIHSLKMEWGTNRNSKTHFWDITETWTGDGVPVEARFTA